MRDVLDKYGLICFTTHRSAGDFINKIDEVIKYNKTLGCDLCWDGIIEACEKAGSLFALVEQDSNWQDNAPFLAMKMSYDFLTEKGFN